MASINYGDILKKILSDIRKKIVYILLFAAVFAILFGFLRSLSPPIYVAKSIFYPDKKEANISGSPLELFQGGDVLQKSGYLNVMAKVLTSRNIISRICLYNLPKPYNSKYSVLADWIIDDNNSKNIFPWQKKLDFKKLTKDQKISLVTPILKSGGFLSVVDDNGFLSLINSNYNSELALFENQVIIDQLIQFNYDVNTQKSKEDLSYINNRLDSVKNAYENIKYQSAQFDDVNKYLIKSVVKVPQLDLEEDKKILSARYQKLAEYQEQALVRYETDKPILKIVDNPYIDQVKQNAIVFPSIITFLILIIVFSIFITRKYFAEIIIAEISAMRNPSK
jgi:Chain length determinant protein